MRGKGEKGEGRRPAGWWCGGGAPSRLYSPPLPSPSSAFHSYRVRDTLERKSRRFFLSFFRRLVSANPSSSTNTLFNTPYLGRNKHTQTERERERKGGEGGNRQPLLLLLPPRHTHAPSFEQGRKKKSNKRTDDSTQRFVQLLVSVTILSPFPPSFQYALFVVVAVGEGGEVRAAFVHVGAHTRKARKRILLFFPSLWFD